MAYDRGLVHLPLIDQTEWKEMLRMRIIFKVVWNRQKKKNNMQARSVPEDPTDGLRQRVSPSSTFRSDRMERDAKNEDNIQSCLEQIEAYYACTKILTPQWWWGTSTPHCEQRENPQDVMLKKMVADNSLKHQQSDSSTYLTRTRLTMLRLTIFYSIKLDRTL